MMKQMRIQSEIKNDGIYVMHQLKFLYALFMELNKLFHKEINHGK